MDSFPDNYRFSHSWRSYQQRILNQIDYHLEDKKLHIVAPPGSGKTVLGLEVVRHLNAPTLILAPTLTIRNQWGERLKIDFLNATKQPEWLSFDLKNPKFLTISTYQSLFAAYKNETTVFEQLKESNLQTLVLDECHHLQKEWWKSLILLTNEIKPTIVALTATPPYDITGYEWQRYQELCGGIDEQIMVPELVAERNLCAHQDYIWFSLPSKKEQEEITSFRAQIEDFVEHLSLNFWFKKTLKEHPYLQNPEAYLEAIYEHPTYFSSLMVVLTAMGRVVPNAVIGIIGADETQIPKMTLEWLEIFLQEAFFKDPHFLQFKEEEDFKKIVRHLRRTGAVERKKVRLVVPKKLDKILSASKGKLESIRQIVDLEYKTLKENLRMVILTDFIRKEAFPKNEFEEELISIGVVPIFELIRRNFPVKIELAILSGSLIIIPKYSAPMLDNILKDFHIPEKEISKTSLPHDSDYYVLSAKGKTKNRLVSIVTELFQRGGISVIVGTKSLLGEGWDAPVINSLVLATFVGSYVSSNQMRGRAIRTFQKNPEKTANIWHLVCVDNSMRNGGSDFKTLRRRFKAFHGISFDTEPTIENGMDRFRLPSLPFHNEEVLQLNEIMTIHANNRLRLRKDWEGALTKGIRMIEEIKIPTIATRKYQKVHQFLEQRAVNYLDEELRFFSKSYIKTVIWSILIASFYFFFNPMVLQTLAIGMSVLILFLPLSGQFIFNKSASFFKVIRYFQKAKRVIKSFRFNILKDLIIFGLAIYYFGFIGITFLLTYLSLTLTSWMRFLNKLKSVPAWKAFKVHDDKASLLENIGQSLLQTLHQLNLFHTPLHSLELKVIEREDESFECFLNNGTLHDENLFLESLQEFLNPIDNPRYMLARKSDELGLLDEVEYFAIPSILGKRKKGVEIFLNNWKEQVGAADLVFTRTVEGRHELLIARGQSFGQEIHPKAIRGSRWG